jgi:hypothetical protein
MPARRPVPPKDILPVVATRFGGTPEGDRAFRREMLLSALTDALFRLRCRRLGIELPSDPFADPASRRRRKAETRS